MTDLEFRTAIRNFERALHRRAADEVALRLHLRETRGLIYVKRYTVKSYFRRARPRRTKH
jgi:hypothetical protein